MPGNGARVLISDFDAAKGDGGNKGPTWTSGRQGDLNEKGKGKRMIYKELSDGTFKAVPASPGRGPTVHHLKSKKSYSAPPILSPSAHADGPPDDKVLAEYHPEILLPTIRKSGSSRKKKSKKKKPKKKKPKKTRKRKRRSR